MKRRLTGIRPETGGATTGQSASAQVATARVATALAFVGVGALSAGAVAIGALAIRRLAVKRGAFGRLSIDELEVRRLRVGELVVTEERRGPQPFEALEGHRFINLRTFRRSGEGVDTPVWFALVDGRVYVTTPPESGKMKRIRNNSRVVMTPCNSRGKPRGESVEGLGRPLDDEARENFQKAESALREKYRLGLTLIGLFRPDVGELTLEVRPVEEAEPVGSAEPLRSDGTL